MRRERQPDQLDVLMNGGILHDAVPRADLLADARADLLLVFVADLEVVHLLGLLEDRAQLPGGLSRRVGRRRQPGHEAGRGKQHSPGHCHRAHIYDSFCTGGVDAAFPLSAAGVSGL